MNETYFLLFEDIDRVLKEQYGSLELELKIVGFAALAFAGLTERGTKDVDALKTEAFTAGRAADLADFLMTEFGKGSAGNLRHGMYLDLVPEEIIWLPPHPRFISQRRLSCLAVSRLHPVDVCVSKTFANFQKERDRGSDRLDIVRALDEQIISFEPYLSRLEEAFPHYECHAQAPEVFPRVLQFLEEMQPLYGPVPWRYSIPSWMERM